MPESVVIADGPAEEQLAAFVAAMDEGRAVSLVNGNWSTALRRAATEDLRRALEPHWLTPDTMLLFTPGTQGRPRAVLRPMRTWRELAHPVRIVLGVSPEDRVWVPGALSTPANLFTAWHVTDLGADVILGYRAHPARLAGVTIAHLMPTMLATVLNAHARGMLPTLRTVVVRGGVVPALRSAARGQDLRLVEMYSATELGVVAWRDAPGAYQPLAGVAVDIDDEGTVWVASPFEALGYLTPGGPLRHRGDWATVGDTGAWDGPEGAQVMRFTLDTVAEWTATPNATLAGTAVAPRLLDVPGVSDAVLLGPDRDLSGQGDTVVVIEGQPTAHALAEALDDVPADALPTRWSLVDRLPRTSLGEVDVELLQMLLVDGTVRVWNTPGDAVDESD